MLPEVCIRRPWPIVISAYTVTSHLGDYYKRATARLQASLLKFDLPHIILPMKKPIDWTHGCSFKADIIHHFFTTLKQPILWIDADGEMFQLPEIFKNATFDMALSSTGGGHWLTGTLYFGMGAGNLINDWKNACSQKEADEITLLNLCRNKHKNLNIKMLPSPYNQIVHSKTDTSKLIIGHYIRPDVAPSRGVKAVKI